MFSKDQVAFSLLLSGLTVNESLSEGAKDVLRKELVEMASEESVLALQAERYGIIIEKKAYLAQHKKLTAYIKLLIESTSTIGVDEFTLKFQSYYNAKEALLRQIMLTMHSILDKHETLLSGGGQQLVYKSEPVDTTEINKNLTADQRALEKQMSLKLGGILNNLSGLTGSIDLRFASMIEQYEQDIYNLGEELRDAVAAKEITNTTLVQADLTGYYSKTEVAQLFNALKFDEFKKGLFDADGYFTGRIRPLAIETTSLSVGSDSTNFTLTTKFRPNYLANPNTIHWDAGFLTHFKMTNDTTFRWTLASGSAASLNPALPYYIYARCSRTGNNGTIVFDTEQRMALSNREHYYFKIGTLSSVILGVRGITLSYGRTEINGREITTGKIQSISGDTYFDLDSGEISGTIKFIPSGGGTPKLVSELSLDLLEVKDYVDNILPTELTDLQNQIDGNITSWFYAYAPSLAVEPALSWSTTILKDTHLGDLFYDTTDGKAYRFQLVGGVYSWQMLSDADITLALANAAAAQDTADGKRRVFVVTPVTPYDIGDLWAQGTGGDLMRCGTTRLTGAYTSGDWVKASKYTDDVMAAQAVLDAASAQTTANTANTNHATLVASLKTLAYEDVVEVAKLGTSIITGGLIKTVLLDADYIKASIINATYIQTLDLVANKITSGKLQSVDGFNYFDLTNNQFKVGNATNYMDWNVTAANALTIKGNIIATSGAIGGYTIAGTQLQATAGGSTVILEAGGVRPYLNFSDGTKSTRLDSEGLTTVYATIRHLNVGGVTAATDTESAMFMNAKYIFSRHGWNPDGTPYYGGRTGGYTADANVFYTQTANGPELVVYKLRSANVIDAQSYTVNGVPLGAGTLDVYTKAQSDANYPTKIGGGASGTWGIAISGNAASATLAANSTKWAGFDYSINPSAVDTYLMGYHGVTGYGAVTAASVKSFLGLDSAAYTASSAYYAAGSTVNNSTAWDSMYYYGADTAVNTYMMGYGADTKWHPIGVGNLRTFLGLGSNAYTSTAFMPITGGNFLGLISVDTVTVTSNQIYRNSSSEFYVNYSGSGATQIGNPAGVNLFGALIGTGATFSGELKGNHIRSDTNIFNDGNYGYGLVGLYDSTKYRSIYAMGSAYQMLANGTGLSNHYGLAFAYEAVGLPQAKVNLGHQLLVVAAGGTQTAIGSGIWTIGNITAPSAVFSTYLTIPAASPASLVAGSLWAVDAVAAGSSPVNYTSLYSLSDVAIGSQVSGQALVWNSGTGKWVAGTVSAGSVDLTNYYTKAEGNGRYVLTINNGDIDIVRTSEPAYGVIKLGNQAGYSTYLYGYQSGYYVYANGAERPLLHSGNFNSYAAPLTGTGASGSWGISITGNAATTSQRTFSNVKTDGISRGSYGSISVAGSTNGYAGIDFADQTVTLMMNNTYQGVMKDDTTWSWYFANGELTVGTVPVARITGLGSNAYSSTAYLPLTGGALSGRVTVEQNADGSNWSLAQFVATSSVNPGYAFHIPGVSARSLYINSSGILQWSGALNVGAITGTSATFSEGLKITGFTIPTGVGPEIVYTSGFGIFQTYDRTLSAYLPTILSGSTLDLRIGGGSAISVDASRNTTLEGTLSGTSASFSGQGRFSGWLTGGTSVGAELGYLSGTTILLSYDRGGGIYKPLSIEASSIAMNSALTGTSATFSRTNAGSTLALNNTTQFTQMDFSNNGTARANLYYDNTASTLNYWSTGTHIFHQALSGTSATFSGAVTAPNFTGIASNASALGGYSGSNFLGKNGNTYYQADTWIQLTGAHGLYHSGTGAHLYPNISVSTHVPWVIQGNKGAYGGIHDSFSGVSGIMYDSTGNGGIYREANGRWYLFHNVANNCMGIGSSATTAGFAAQINGHVKATGGYHVNEYGNGLVGVYDSTKYRSIYAMSSDYQMLLDGTGLSNHYGLAFAYDYVSQAKAGLGHQLLVVAAGTTQTAIGTGIWTNGTITAPTAILSTRLKIPTSAPASPIAGDLWMIAV